MTADTYSTDGIGVLLMGTGNDNNTWGANANTSVFQIIMDALANVLTSAVTGGTLTLSGTPPPASASQVRYAALKFTGILSSNQIVQVPNLNKWWLVCNATSGAFTLKFKTPSGSASTAIPQNSGWQMVRCDGSDVMEVWPFNTNQILMPDGTAALPPHSFLTDPTSGFYLIGAGNIGLSLAGTKRIDFSTSGVVITGTFGVSSTFTASGTFNASGTSTFSGVATFNSTPILQSTDGGATTGPTLDLYRNSGTPGAAYEIGSVDFNGKDSGGNKTLYGRIEGLIGDTTNGSEDGAILYYVMRAGTLSLVSYVDATTFFVDNNASITGSLNVTGAVSGGTAAGAMVATQAEQETGSATDKLVTPGRQQFHPSAAKWWLKSIVTGGSPAQTANYNVTSLTDTAVGRLTVTIGTDFSSADWTCVGSVTQAGAATRTLQPVSEAGGSVELDCLNASNTLTDPEIWHAAGFGDQ